MNAAPVRRSMIVPSACRKRHALYRSMPRDSRTWAGTHDNSAPVSTSTDLSVRRSPGRAGFSISTSTRKLPMSSGIVTPEISPGSIISLRRVSMSAERTEALERALVRFAPLLLAIARRRVDLQGMDQPAGRRRHLVHRPLEHRGVGLGGPRRAAQLADELQLRRLNFLY